MMTVTTLDKAIDIATQLPPEQQEMLLEILQRRHVEARRKEIAEAAQESLAAFRAGKLSPQSADEVIAELRRTLEDVE